MVMMGRTNRKDRKRIQVKGEEDRGTKLIKEKKKVE
jgi:hypothetical protein